MALLPLRTRDGYIHGTVEEINYGPTKDEAELKVEFDERRRQAEELARKRDHIAALKRELVGQQTKLTKIKAETRVLREAGVHYCVEHRVAGKTYQVPMGSFSDLIRETEDAIATIEDSIARAEQELETS